MLNRRPNTLGRQCKVHNWQVALRIFAKVHWQLYPRPRQQTLGRCYYGHITQHTAEAVSYCCVCFAWTTRHTVDKRTQKSKGLNHVVSKIPLWKGPLCFNPTCQVLVPWWGGRVGRVHGDEGRPAPGVLLQLRLQPLRAGHLALLLPLLRPHLGKYLGSIKIFNCSSSLSVQQPLPGVGRSCNFINNIIFYFISYS